jgi:starch-binding outer membrane protein, SusD/RagB family
MNKKYFILFCISLFMLIQTSCLKEYLDQAPEAGLSEEAVFSKYANFKLYFDAIYNGSNNMNIKNGFNLFFCTWNQRTMSESFTDMSDQGRIMLGQRFKQGSALNDVPMFTDDTGRRPILASMIRCIRIANTTLQKINMLKDATDAEKADFLGQAFFYRGFAHFTIVKWWGGMPYLDKVIGVDDAWDMPRLSAYETLMRISNDMDSAVFYFRKAGLMRRDDPTPGNAGHLNNDNLFRPTGCSALGLKARVLLYAASPLNNAKGVADWERAAEANMEALETALANGYKMYDMGNYTTNWYGTRYTNEELWGYSFGNLQSTAWDEPSSIISGAVLNVKDRHSGACPSQNFIDRYETANGDPLNTEADRTEAASLGHYNDQDPYANLDPRFYKSIIYNGGKLAGFTPTNGNSDMYYERVNGNIKYSVLVDRNTYAGCSYTGYYIRKLTGDLNGYNNTAPLLTDPVIRITELYLNYAEAANEAYGPNGGVPGKMTAAQALYEVRRRVNMPDVQDRFKVDAATFRTRIKNERIVELCFEGHYYFDIRRWKDAPALMSGTIMGMDIEKVPVSVTYPKGFKYTRVPLPAARQMTWKDPMYYLPFKSDYKNKMTLFVPNEEW